MCFLNIRRNPILFVFKIVITTRCCQQATIKTFFEHCDTIGRIALTKLGQN